jgi:hypothetical protein
LLIYGSLLATRLSDTIASTITSNVVFSTAASPPASVQGMATPTLADASTQVCSICVTNSDDSIKVNVLTGQ